MAAYFSLQKALELLSMRVYISAPMYKYSCTYMYVVFSFGSNIFYGEKDRAELESLTR